MSILQNKIDFATIVSVTRANINGDPLNGNRPREDYNGHGIFSDVAIKRKIRNRLQDMGESIFVQTDGRETDQYRNLRDRAASDAQLDAELKKGKDADTDLFSKIACEKWIDVRAFGQVFAFKKGQEESERRNTYTFRHRNIVIIKTDEDSNKIKEALCTLFENDASSARPDGTCEVCRVYWWKHSDKTPKETSAIIQRSLKITSKVEEPHSFDDYDIPVPESICVPEIIELNHIQE